MLVRIDFESDVALYIQLRDQIIMGIATETIKNGESLPSVRQMAEEIGINMHTVNKTYALLREEGFITLDRRNGAVVKLDVDKIKAVKCLKEDMKVVNHLRCLSIDMIDNASSGHPGICLGAATILYTLYHNNQKEFPIVF